jgi:hypothetical protein
VGDLFLSLAGFVWIFVGIWRSECAIADRRC